MFDILPFPNITATDTKEQVSQINNYLIQFKETLEFVLGNISVENLSPELRAHLNSLGAEIKTNREEQEDITQQMVHKTITVSDVLTSQLFDDYIKGLKYFTSGEQTKKSTESGGLNVYTFTKSDGSTSNIEVYNGQQGAKGDVGEKGEKGDKGDKGDKPTVVTFDIDFATGELLYTLE